MVNSAPILIPATAPFALIRLKKIPIISVGKMDEAAIPNAKATVCAANPGGLIPSHVAMTIAPPIDIRAASISALSEMFGYSVFLIKS